METIKMKNEQGEQEEQVTSYSIQTWKLNGI